MARKPKRLYIPPPDYSQAMRVICLSLDLEPPEPEYHFAAPERDWRFDFAWIEDLVAVEVEGGVFGRGKECPLCGQRPVGAHSSIQGKLRDIEKYNAAGILGWRVFSILPGWIEGGELRLLLQRIFDIR